MGWTERVDGSEKAGLLLAPLLAIEGAAGEARVRPDGEAHAADGEAHAAAAAERG